MSGKVKQKQNAMHKEIPKMVQKSVSKSPIQNKKKLSTSRSREVQDVQQNQLIKQKLNTVFRKVERTTSNLQQSSMQKLMVKKNVELPLKDFKQILVEKEIQKLRHYQQNKRKHEQIIKPNRIYHVDSPISNQVWSQEEDTELNNKKNNNKDNDKDNHEKVSSFWTCKELSQSLSHVLKLREIFDLFAKMDGWNTIDVRKVAECLRAMGLHFVKATFDSYLMQRLLKFPQSQMPSRVSFEFVLTLYCDLACLEDMPPAAVMINGLSCCDTKNTGLLPYNMLRHMLTSIGDRLDDLEASALLDNMTDDKGNVRYVELLENVFLADTDAADKLRQSRLYLNALGKNAAHMDMHKRDEFIRALRTLDTMHTGYVPFDRLLHQLNANGDRFTVPELTSLTRGMLNRNKEVDYHLFLSLIMND